MTELQSDELVFHSSESDEWYTPPHIISALVDALGVVFSLDPSSGAEEVPYAKQTITDEEGGLTKKWVEMAQGPIFVNYPYSDHAAWMAKVTEEARKPDSQTIVVLTKATSDTQWWKDSVIYADMVCNIHQRVRFGGSNENAPFPSAILVYNWGSSPDELKTLLQVWGDCYSPTQNVDLPPAPQRPEIKGHRWSKDNRLCDRPSLSGWE